MTAHAPVTNLPEKLRLRVEDFELLEGSGTFEGYGKAELIDGDVYTVNAQYAQPNNAKVAMVYALMKWIDATKSDLQVYSEVSLRLAKDSMPEPDLFLAPRQGFGSVPVEGVALVIEVADTTLSTDLGRKAELYAAAGVPEYWVVDVNGGRVLAHVGPDADGYAERGEVPFGAVLKAVTIEGLRLEGVWLG